MKLTIKDIHKILAEGLGNIELGIQVNISTGGVNLLTQPAIEFLDDEEKLEKSKIQDFNRIKSVITDPNEKKVKDNSIKTSQSKLSKINQTRTNLMAKKIEFEKQKLKSQDDLQLQMNQLKQHMDMLNSLRDNVQEMYDKNYALPILKRAQLPHLEIADDDLKEAVPGAISQTMPIPQPEKKPAFKVKFEGSSANPFEVFFSERGFKIGNTRLSFETIEDALSKNFSITLENGNGLVLDAVRMQKILRYKNRT